MKYLALFLVLCLLLSGCASYTPPPGPLRILTEPQMGDTLKKIDPEFSSDPGETGGNDPQTTPCGGEITLTYLPMGVCTAVSSSFSDYEAEQTLAMILTNASYDLDYCDCIAEYTVILPEAGEYQFNLSDCYARHDGAQASLTDDQVAANRYPHSPDRGRYAF